MYGKILRSRIFFIIISHNFIFVNIKIVKQVNMNYYLSTHGGLQHAIALSCEVTS